MRIATSFEAERPEIVSWQSAAAMTQEEAAQLIEAAEYLAGMESVLAMLSEEQVDALLEMEALQPGMKMWIASLYGKTIQ